MNGMAAVVYDCDNPYDDIETLMEFLIKRRKHLKLDHERIGVYAVSGHGEMGLHVIMNDNAIYSKGIKGGLLLHGLMRSARELRTDVPLMIVYTDSPDALDMIRSGNQILVRRAQSRGLPIEVIDDAPMKNFQYIDQTERSREILRNCILFMKKHLKA